MAIAATARRMRWLIKMPGMTLIAPTTPVSPPMWPGRPSPMPVELKGGDGIGTVTMPGLGLTVGGPAINPVPRRNIEDNIRLIAAEHLRNRALQVTLSVPDGEDMAKKTLNYRLGLSAASRSWARPASFTRIPPPLFAPASCRALRWLPVRGRIPWC